MREWINAPKEISKDMVGFVYVIEEIDTGMKYIGCKKFWKTTRRSPNKYMLNKDGTYKKDKNGKRILSKRTTKIKTIVESDWREYNTSSPIMQSKLNKPSFKAKKTIIRICYSVSEMKAYEAYIQLKSYFDGNWDNFYNEIINLRVTMKK